MTGPTIYGAYLDPQRVIGVDLEGLDRSAVVKAIANQGTEIAWEREVDGKRAMLTHAGGVFIEFPAHPSADDPIAEKEAEKEEAVALANLVLSELALVCETYASAFSIVDLASAQRNGNRVEVWAATSPFAPIALAIQAVVTQGAEELAMWERTPPEKLRLLGGLEIGVGLREIAENLPSFVAAAHGHAYRRRPAEGLLFAWMSCEQLLSHLWEKHVAGGGFDAAHRKRLRDGRTYSAAVQAESLRLVGVMPKETYEALTRARSQRNKLAHNATLETNAIEVALTALYGMLRLVTDPPESDETA
jgi:hypothetical protein